MIIENRLMYKIDKSMNYLSDNVPREILLYSEMSSDERRFLCELLMSSKPRRVLEVGVAEGASSAVIWNAIKSVPDSELYSVDISKMFYRDKNKETGFCSLNYIGTTNDRWHRYFGYDCSDLLDEFLENDIYFDFLFLDTVHVHPAETLNFLSVLPALTKNAIVVIHDISLFQNSIENKTKQDFKRAFACNILFSNLVGSKYSLYEDEINKTSFGNIGVVQINDDTRNYIGNLFYSLSFPWGFIDFNFAKIDALVSKYYPDYFLIYEKSKNNNCILYKNKYFSYKKDYFPSELKIIDGSMEHNKEYSSSVFFLVDNRTDSEINKLYCKLLAVPILKDCWYHISFQIVFLLLKNHNSSKNCTVTIELSYNPNSKKSDLISLGSDGADDLLKQIYYVLNDSGLIIYAKPTGINTALYTTIKNIHRRDSKNVYAKPVFFSDGSIGKADLFSGDYPSLFESL